MVDALHVAARRDELEGVRRYLERHCAKGDISLDRLRRRYSLRAPRLEDSLPALDIPEHSLQSYDQLLDGTPEPGGAGERPAGSAQTIETGPVPQPVAGR